MQNTVPIKKERSNKIILEPQGTLSSVLPTNIKEASLGKFKIAVVLSQTANDSVHYKK